MESGREGRMGVGSEGRIEAERKERRVSGRKGIVKVGTKGEGKREGKKQ
jgi:hypothetical protein